MGDAQTTAPGAQAPPRFRLFDALLSGAKDIGEAEAQFSQYADRMRFSVGQVVGVPRIPFAVGTDLTESARAAVDDLVALIRRRASDDTLGHDARHMEILPRSFGMRRVPDSARERRLLAAIAGTDPLLDVGFLESWLLRGGNGARLFACVTGILSKSLDEEARLGFAEPLGWATHLAMTGALLAEKERLKSHTIKGVPYESLERTVGIALSAVLALAADEKLVAMSSAGILSGSHRTAVLLRAGCSPFSAISIRQAMLRLTPNPYRLPRELADALDRCGVNPTEPGVSCEEKAAAVDRAIGRDRAVRAQCADAWGMNELRSAVLAYLRSWEGGADPRFDALLAAVYTVPTMTACLKDADRFDAAGEAIASLTADAAGERREAGNSVLQAFERVSRRAVDVEAMARRSARAWLLYRLDRWVEDRVEFSRAALVDRAKEFSVAELKSQWQSGKVYRFAPDKLPILWRAEAREDGHFFLDLKGFTRMVARAKEVSTAEFLKHQFYVPILARARSYREVGRRLELNNLLGDAVSFSGDIVSLVMLAEDVNDLFFGYEKSLADRGIAAERTEAGLFITYGAAAETITVDDPMWSDAGISQQSADGKNHRVKVSIAEKINESARGTARNSAVLARMTSLLADRTRSAPPGTTLELPWRVYVDKSLQVRLPPRVIEMVEQAIETRGPEMNAMAVGVVTEAIASVLQRIADEGNDGSVFSQAADLYNVGRALSKDALEAFLRETGAYRVFVRKQIAVLELHPDFRRFVFPDSELRLVVSWDTGKAARRPMVFRFAGDLTFRGFEGMHTTEIWEMVDAMSPVFALLEQHYLAAWRPGD